MDDKEVQYGLVDSDFTPVEAKTCGKAGTLKVSHRDQVHVPERGTLCMC